MFILDDRVYGDRAAYSPDGYNWTVTDPVQGGCIFFNGRWFCRVRDGVLSAERNGKGWERVYTFPSEQPTSLTRFVLSRSYLYVSWWSEGGYGAWTETLMWSRTLDGQVWEQVGDEPSRHDIVHANGYWYSTNDATASSGPFISVREAPVGPIIRTQATTTSYNLRSTQEHQRLDYSVSSRIVSSSTWGPGGPGAGDWYVYETEPGSLTFTETSSWPDGLNVFLERNTVLARAPIPLGGYKYYAASARAFPAWAHTSIPGEFVGTFGRRFLSWDNDAVWLSDDGRNWGAPLKRPRHLDFQVNGSVPLLLARDYNDGSVKGTLDFRTWSEIPVESMFGALSWSGVEPGFDNLAPGEHSARGFFT